MSNLARWVVAVCLAFVLAPVGISSGSVETPSKQARIEELMELTGAGDLGVQAVSGLVGSLKQALPEVPDEWWNKFIAEVDADALIEMSVPIYERHFTDEEIDAMLEFYRTPAGRSVISKMPLVMQESMAVGQAWGEQLARDILRELKEDGYELPPGLES